MTITLTPQLEQAVTKQAEQQGTTPELMIMDSLQKLYLPSPPLKANEGETLANYWADYIGSLDSSEVVPGGANLSENTGSKFAALMVEKYQKGNS